MGDSYTDLLSVTGTDLNLLSQTQTDSVAVTATFTLPGSATGVIGGTGSLTDTLHFAWEGTYWADTGTITWDPNTNPTEIAFTDGSILQLAMDNIQLSGIDGTANGSGNLTMTVEKVPEPATLALLGVGLLGLGMVARRRPAGSIPA